MNFQILQDSNGNKTGVYIPIEDWNMILNTYPDVEHLDNDIPEWHKQILDARLEDLVQNPGNVKPIENLFAILDSEE